MKKFLLPARARLYALGAGVLGFALRLWLLKTTEDGSSLLPLAHPADPMTYILTALVLIILYLCLRRLDGVGVYKQMFPKSLPAAVGCFVAAAGVLITDIIEVTTRLDGMMLFSCIAGLLAAASFVLLGLATWQHKRPSPLFHGLVCLYLILHLVSQYRLWNAEPQLQNYFFQLLASVFLMLCAYHRTAVDCSRNNRRLYLFFNYGALFLCCLAAVGSDWLFYLSMALWTGTCACSVKQVKAAKTMELPQPVLYCIEKLTNAGYSTYAVGGSVRDSLLGVSSQDYDLCTAATPEQIAVIFADHELVHKGEKHGTIGVVLEGTLYEITTFRTEGGYSDSRHPDWVQFVPSVREDLARRDFTVNAMAYGPDCGYIDPWGGEKDLKARILRAVGDPRLRFTEDPLRILRGIRFSAQLGLTPEKETMDAMLALAPTMDKLAKERVCSELQKFLCYATAEDLIRFAPIITQVIPELAPTLDFCQHSPHHAYDVYTHTAHTVEAVPAEPALRLAALLHDIGKPEVFTLDEEGRGHFYGHAKVGAKTAEAVLQRFRVSNALREEVIFLIEQHMTPLEPEKKYLRRRLSRFGYKAMSKLVILQKADFDSKGVTEDVDPQFGQVTALLEELMAEDTCLKVTDLAITGNEILALGTEPGPHIGACMSFLLELVQDEVIPNTKEELLQAAKQFLSDEQEEM